MAEATPLLEQARACTQQLIRWRLHERTSAHEAQARHCLSDRPAIMRGTDPDRGCLTIERAGVLTDQHVLDLRSRESRGDREQICLARDAEHHSDGPRRGRA